MRQTAAIFLDAYRELNAKKLFWFVLAISGLVVGVLGMLGIDRKGMTFLHWSLGFGINTGMMSKAMFYKSVLFMGLGVKFWLSWLATILALVSTAGIIPDFIAGGAVELVLSKPLGRLRLFLTKYAAALLFVGLQVAVFTGAAFLVIGLRAGSWEWGLFIAVPLVLLFFSYLYSICALLGLITRSTIASLLLTLLIWFGLFGAHSAETITLSLREFNAAQVERLQSEIAARERRLEQADDDPAEATPDRRFLGSLLRAMRGGRADTAPTASSPEENRRRLAARREQLENAQKNSRWFITAHRIAYGIKTALPKTSETVQLLERTLVSRAELKAMLDENGGVPITIDGQDEVPVNPHEIQRRVALELRDRSTVWVIGTSLAFEVVMLGLASWIFCRRDF